MFFTFNDCEAKQSIHGNKKEQGRMVNTNWRLGSMGSNEGFIGKKANASLTSGGNGVQRSSLFT